MPTPMAHHGSISQIWLPKSRTLNGVIGRIPASYSQYQPKLQSTLMIRSQMQYRLGPNPPTLLRPLSTGSKSRVTLPSMSLGRGPRTGD
ncbi:hypothetical protein M9H77_23301 [Catharanthus roseus]|uniref:Uncharacterized protein n=1 Tax=Catharanthus roseus TaxID=4058 RepID=A0ACC0AVV8_CATRO|nr:hypothetical protein M9H77_23301 [Catharanthus roseus]